MDMEIERTRLNYFLRKITNLYAPVSFDIHSLFPYLHSLFLLAKLNISKQKLLYRLRQQYT